METATIDQAAVEVFLSAPAGTVVTAEMRRVVAERMETMARGNERPMGPNGRVNRATMLEIVRRLREGI